MLNRYALTLVPFLVASAGAIQPTPAHRAPSTRPNTRPLLEVVVDGAERPQYQARGTRYVEAIRGKDYEIRLRNPYGVRVAVALAVDGLNTIDARHTSAADARKWVLEPYQTVTLTGWQISDRHARRFTFTSEERSYAQRLGQTDNLGIISAVFFRERADRAWPTLALDTAAPASPAPAVPAGTPTGQANAAQARSGSVESSLARESYAATGQGARTEHRVERVHMDLEETPAARVQVRYEYRAQLVQLGVLAPEPATSPLTRRERARGFEGGYCPETY